jgi:hypothetical protein
MSTLLNIQDVCNRGFRDATSLTPQERLVYLLADLESLKDMEGWDHFFTTNRMRYYRDLVTGLEAAGDTVSLEILHAYETPFSSYGVAFEASAIAKFLSDVPEAFWKSRDWESEFELAKEDRWSKVDAYLTRCGYALAG